MTLLKVIILIAFIVSLNNCQSDKLIIIAHRGGSKLAPENTLAAFKNAMTLGVDMIEIDVILSKDKEVVVIHDDRIDRTTNGSGIVKEMNLSEIQKYSAGDWFDSKYKDEKIPTLNQVMNLINGKVKLLIEIKGGDEEYPGLENKVIEIIEKYNAFNWVIVQSFNEQTVLRVKKGNKKIITFYLLGKNGVQYLEELQKIDRIENKYDGLAPNYNLVNKTNLEMIKNHGLKCFVWTVNELDIMKEMIKLKVDGIITDSPNQLKELL